MFQINSEVIALDKFEVNDEKFEGTAVANIKVTVKLVKKRNEDLEIHTAYEFESDAESGGSLSYEAKGMITVKDDERPTAIGLYDVVVFHLGRVFDILIGNCKVAKANPPEKPDVNMLQDAIMEMLEEGLTDIYDNDGIIDLEDE